MIRVWYGVITCLGREEAQRDEIASQAYSVFIYKVNQLQEEQRAFRTTHMQN
jgi:hypothetical protein